VTQRPSGDDVRVRQAGPGDVDRVAPLFDAYRQFYAQAPDLPLARRYLAERLGRAESVLFLAEDATSGEPLGFTQLYPTFCSVAARPIWVLYDLFTTARARRRGVGRLLMDRARDHAAASGAHRIVLSTAHTNTDAQALYESLGYRLDTTFRVYELLLE